MATHQTSIIEIHRDGRWQSAATIQALGPDRCRVEYETAYLFSQDPWPIATGMPVGMHPDNYLEGPTGTQADRRPPAFLYDLVPQGKGRRYLLDRLGLTDSENLIVPLVLAGAFNPIGGLRVSSALEFFREEARANPDPATAEGFALDEVLLRTEAFLDHLSLHAMLASGTTGVQGVAPKFLLAVDKHGRWFADMALADEDAAQHWLVKLPRGKSEGDRSVLRNEAPYLRVAARCGLRSQHEPMLHGEALFVRRFDRETVNGQVRRHLQESLASVCGLRGFGLPRNQHDLLAGLRAVVSDPARDTLEFIKRDVLNLAMRNTDNHARNTAVQRLADGTVQLTPVFDFAPMFLDPEVVTRGCHWRDANGTRQARWTEIVASLALNDEERAHIAAELADFASVVGNLSEIALDCGVEKIVMDQCKRQIDAQAEQLHALASYRDGHGG